MIIPPQAIQGGVPTLEIYEGKIIHYEINGEIGDVKKLIARYLDNLLTDKPARWEELERYLLLSRDLPGISLTGTLRSAGDNTPGGVILVVDVARKPVDAFVNMQNRNADVTGPWTASVGLSVNSNTEYGERLGIVGLAAVQPFEQLSTFFIYEHAIGDEGLRLKISNTLGFANPRDALKPLKLESETSLFTFEAEYPAVRSRTFSLWTRGGFEIADQTGATARYGIVLLRRPDCGHIFAGARWIWFAPLRRCRRMFDVELRKGSWRILGHSEDQRWANPPDARSRSDSEFRLHDPEGHGQPCVSRSRRSSRSTFEVKGQVADKPLPSLEEFAPGELFVGRGFEPGAITGDSGFGGDPSRRASRHQGWRPGG